MQTAAPMSDASSPEVNNGYRWPNSDLPRVTVGPPVPRDPGFQKRRPSRRPTLDLASNSAADLAASYELSDFGTFKVSGFEINSQGLKYTDPPADVSGSLLMKSSSVSSLGSGAGRFSQPHNRNYSQYSEFSSQLQQPHLSRGPASSSLTSHSVLLPENSNASIFGSDSSSSSSPPPLAAAVHRSGLSMTLSTVPERKDISAPAQFPGSIGDRMDISFTGTPYPVPLVTAGHARPPAAASSGSSTSGTPFGDVDEGTLKLSDLLQLGEVGRGACGTVVKAVHLPTFKLLAIKRISVFDKDKRHQLVKELTAFSRHGAVPELISMRAAFYDQGCVFMVLEYMNRRSLQDLVTQCGPLPEPLLRHIAVQVLRGLRHLHAQHVVHRDVKPGNILINHKGEVKLADFGVLTALDNSQDLANSHVGTTVYMSPERVVGSYGTPADIWSFGASLVALSTGQPPFDTSEGYFGIVRRITNGPAPAPPRTCSPQFASFVSACLTQDPLQRSTAAQLLAHEFLVGSGVGSSGGYGTLPMLSGSASQWLQTLAAPTAQDLTDLQSIAQIMVQRLYLATGESYRRSLFELARFQKISTELGVPLQDVQRCCEAVYAALVGNQQQQQQQSAYSGAKGFPEPHALLAGTGRSNMDLNGTWCFRASGPAGAATAGSSTAQSSGAPGSNASAMNPYPGMHTLPPPPPPGLGPFVSHGPGSSSTMTPDGGGLQRSVSMSQLMQHQQYAIAASQSYSQMHPMSQYPQQQQQHHPHLHAAGRSLRPSSAAVQSGSRHAVSRQYAVDAMDM